MQESYGEGLATHTGPESCAIAREGGSEALTGERAGWVLSRERSSLRDADAVEEGGRPHPGRREGKTLRSPARSETPSMPGHTSRENRESPWSPAVDGTEGRVGKSMDRRRR
jgi:RNA-directed DNA polymerase